MVSLKQIITKFYRDDEHNCGNGYMHMNKDKKKNIKSRNGSFTVVGFMTLK